MTDEQAPQEPYLKVDDPVETEPGISINFTSWSGEVKVSRVVGITEAERWAWDILDAVRRVRNGEELPKEPE